MIFLIPLALNSYEAAVQQHDEDCTHYLLATPPDEGYLHRFEDTVVRESNCEIPKQKRRGEKTVIRPESSKHRRLDGFSNEIRQTTEVNSVQVVDVLHGTSNAVVGDVHTERAVFFV